MSREPIEPNPQTNRMLGSSPAGTPKNYRVVSVDKMKQKKVRPEVRQRLMNKLNKPTPGGDVDPETGDLIPESIHEIAFTDRGRAALAADQVEPSAPIPPKSKVSDDMMKKALKKAMDQYKSKPKPNDQTPPGMNTESVQKAGHPEAYELGLDKDTTDNKEYQRILRHKRMMRAAMMSNPDHPDHDSDDVSQDDVEAADKAARGRKYTPRNVGRDGY